jgi:hypothetical protein
MSLRWIEPRQFSLWTTLNLLSVVAVGPNPSQDWKLILFCVDVMWQRIWRCKRCCASVAITFESSTWKATFRISWIYLMSWMKHFVTFFILSRIILRWYIDSNSWSSFFVFRCSVMCGQVDELWEPHFRTQTRATSLLVVLIRTVATLLTAWENAAIVACWNPLD